MYMLAIKNRGGEYRAVEALKDAGCMENGVMTLVEVIREETTCDYLVDPYTGEYIKENRPVKSGKNKGADRWCKVKDPSSERDVTLENIEKRFAGRPVFVDYFRCAIEKYKNANHSKCPLVIKLTNNLDAYVGKVKAIAEHASLIPVITVKSGIDKLGPSQLIQCAEDLKRLREGHPIAIRIDDIDGYERACEKVLGEGDYLIYDINEAPAVSKTVEFEEVCALNTKAKKILLCSPRKRDVRNGTYAQGCVIDNSHIYDYEEYGFDGVGDYAGLHDKLPGDGGGKGCALAMLYDGRKNEFTAYVNQDVSLGASGYREVVERVLADRTQLEQRPGECIVLDAVSRNAACGSYGSWQTWITYTIERYVHQLYLAHGGYAPSTLFQG